MAKSKTPSFVTELPLKVSSKLEIELLSRLQAARQLYNCCLGEALIRLPQVRNSESYKQAKNNKDKEPGLTQLAQAMVREAHRAPKKLHRKHRNIWAF